MSKGARTRTASRRRVPCARAHSRGVTVVVVLLLLLVTMLMGVSSVRTAGTEERMAGHTRDRMVAFQAAEAALRDAEAMIAADRDGPYQPLRPGVFSSACTNGLCASSPNAPLAPGFSDADWQSTKTFAYGATTGVATPGGTSATPRYAIEYQGTLQPIEPGRPCTAIYLVTARARGASPSSDVIVQSTYRHRSGECYAAI